MKGDPSRPAFKRPETVDKSHRWERALLVYPATRAKVRSHTTLDETLAEL
jgi:hypothetical protein